MVRVASLCLSSGECLRIHVHSDGFPESIHALTEMIDEDTCLRHGRGVGTLECPTKDLLVVNVPSRGFQLAAKYRDVVQHVQ
jgi:hypothetical protein